MSVGPVDLVLCLACLLMAFAGLRRGFMAGLAAFVGVVAGGALGLLLAAAVHDVAAVPTIPRPIVTGTVVVGVSALGLACSGRLAGLWHRRQRTTGLLVRRADAIAGALLNVTGLLVLAWLAAAAAPSWEHPQLVAQLQRSDVIATVDRVVPPGADAFPERLRAAVDGRPGPGELPAGRPVEPADPALSQSRAVDFARASVLRVTGVADQCPKRRRLYGSAFVFAADRLMTNAHVVAGVTRVRVETPRGARDADVLLFDAATDIAILHVPDLGSPALPFAAERARRGADAVALGYPGNGPLAAQPGRIRGAGTATSTDSTTTRRVTRDVYDVQATIRPGNSGGPLLTPDGHVLGMITAVAEDDPNVGYALTVAELAPAARTASAGRTTPTTSACDPPIAAR